METPTPGFPGKFSSMGQHFSFNKMDKFHPCGYLHEYLYQNEQGLCQQQYFAFNEMLNFHPSVYLHEYFIIRGHTTETCSLAKEFMDLAPVGFKHSQLEFK
jgi:hypothetical protein